MKHEGRKGAALLAAFVCLLTGCKGGDKASGLPTEYTVGGESVPAFTLEETEAPVTEKVTSIYTYDGLTAAGEAAANYAAQLTAEESGFSVVDEGYVRTDLPDFTQAEGSVRLARAAVAEEETAEAEEEESKGKLISLLLSWSEGVCTVAVSREEGVIQNSPRPGAGTTRPANMTITEALEYFKGLSPAIFGLSGSSMRDYNIYALDGTVLVDGNPCLRLNVYSIDNPQQANQFVGTYLMTGDGQHLYLLDEHTGTVEELAQP